jgi:hypothetical protein
MADQQSSRTVGFVTIATGIAALALLANHPGEGATDFVGVLKEEAANRVANFIVHGGYIVVLAIQLSCYAILTGRFAANRAPAIAALVIFAVGAGLQMASLIADGIMTPALAVHYLAAPKDQLPFARASLVLIGTAVRFLMPAGMAFQATGVLSWGAALLRNARIAGLIAFTLGLGVVGAVAGAMQSGNQMLFMSAIVGLTLWPFLAGGLMLRRTA